MKQKVFVAATVVLSMLSTSKSVNAQQTNATQQANASQRSYQQARRVLDDGIEAMGGLDALRGIKDFTLKEKGKIYARGQSQNPDPPFATGPSEETLIVDTERGFLFNEVKTANGGFNNWFHPVRVRCL